MSEQLKGLRVIIPDFIDRDDNRYKYKPMEKYPREGYEPTAERVKALATGNNAAERVIVARVLEDSDFEDVNDNQAIATDTDYADLNKEQLQDLLKQKDIDFKSNDKKDDLIKLLEGE